MTGQRTSTQMAGGFDYSLRAENVVAAHVRRRRNPVEACRGINQYRWLPSLAFQISVQPATTLAKYATRPPSDRRGSRLPPRICSLESKRDSRVNDFVHAT
jgi:hypothetical protein